MPALYMDAGVKLEVLQVGEVQQYLRQGPGFIFLWHPSLGPLWDIIAQKVTGGALAPGSELILEVGPARNSCPQLLMT